MNPPRPILILLTPGFPASADDRDCLPMHALFVRTLAARYPGVDVQVIAFQYPYRVDAYALHGAQVLPLNGRNRRGVHAWALRRKALQWLVRTAALRKVIGVMSFWYGDCAAVGERFARRSGVPHYCWILGQDARAGNPWPARVPLPAERLLALSPFLQAEFFRRHGRRPAHVLPPGIDPAEYPDQAPPRDIHLIGVGSLIPLKRFGRFLEVVAQLLPIFPGLRALLVGTGPEEKRLKAQACKLGIDGVLRFTGALPHAEVLGLMQRARILVHPSSYEGFSGVCMEALAAGAHVVSHCRALDGALPQWHIVPEEDELLATVRRVLQDERAQVPVQPFRMADTVAALRAFFPALRSFEDAVDLPGDGRERKLLLEPRAQPAS